MPEHATAASNVASNRTALPDKLPLLKRAMPAEDFRVATGDDGYMRFSFSCASETPVARWYGDEVLSHDASAVRMDRISGGAAPYLFNHDMDDPVGMVEGGRIENKRLVVDVKLFKTERAQEVAAMIDGGLRNVSLLYRIHKYEEDIDNETYTATDWEPYEVSVVTVPADPTVGIGRAQDSGEQFEYRMIRRGVETAAPPNVPSTTTASTADKERQMPEMANAAASDNAVKVNAVQAEKERAEAINNLCRAYKIAARVADQWIQDGTALTEVAAQIVKVQEERAKTKPLEASTLGLTSSETRNYSLFRAIRAMRFGNQNPKFMEEAGFEIECSRSLAQQLKRELTHSILIPAEVLQRPLGDGAQNGKAARAMATTPGSKGGFMVSVTNMGFIDILRNRSVAMAMGSRVMSGLQGNVTFPRQTGKVTVTWQGGEGTSTTAADQALGQLSMTPKTCIAITDISEQLLAQASPSAEAFVMADLANDVAIDGIDNAVINGTGGAQPLGIKNTTGVATSQDAASATYAKVLAFVSTAGTANAIRGNPGWVTNTAGAAKLMQVQRFTSTDTPVWTGNMLDGQLVGFNAMSSEQLSSGNLIFGSWDEVVIGEWGVLELSMDNGGTRFNQAQVGIRAMWMVDVLVRYPQAFVVSTNLS